MKSNIIKLYTFALLMAICGSCSDYLEKEPLSQYLSGSFYSNEEAIKQGTNGVYNTIYMESSSLPFHTLYDMYTPFGIERADNASMGVGTVNYLTNFPIETAWAKFYEGVGRCNTVLDGAAPYYGELNDKSKQYLAEVTVIRSFHYHYLTSLFSDVPFFTKSVTDIEAKSALRTPWRTIVDQLIIDLDDAAYYLPWQAEAMGRVDKTFALGLKARIALYAGSWCQLGIGETGTGKNTLEAEKYFKIAAEASRKIIDESGRSLCPNFPDLFTNEGQLTPLAKSENVFSLIYSGEGSGKRHYLSFGEQCRMIGQSGRFPTQLFVDTYEMANGKRIDEAGSGYNPKTPFINRDPRLKHTVYTHHDTIIGNAGGTKKRFLMEVYNPKLKSFDSKGVESMIDNLDYAGSVAQYGYVQSGVGFLWKKYNHFDEQVNSAAIYNIHLMRYAEILLIYAEAKVELNELDPTVASAIDEVRARVGMPSILQVDPSRQNSQAKMRQIVRRERKVELGRESLTFFDMRRWRIGLLANAEPTYGFPVAIGVDAAKNIYPNGYDQVTPDMVPSYGVAGSERDLNDLALYATYASKLRTRDAARPTAWVAKYYLWPIPHTERLKSPWLTQNEGYGN